MCGSSGSTVLQAQTFVPALPVQMGNHTGVLGNPTIEPIITLTSAAVYQWLPDESTSGSLSAPILTESQLRSYQLGTTGHIPHVTLVQRHLKKARSPQVLVWRTGMSEQEGRCFIQEVSDKWGKCDYDSDRPCINTQDCGQRDTLHGIDRSR